MTPSDEPATGSFTPASDPASSPLDPATDPVTAVFTPNEEDDQRLIEYGDQPLLDGSIEYGQLIGTDGFMEEAEEPEAGSFTPSS